MKAKYLLAAVLITGLFCWSAAAQDETKPAKAPKITHRQMHQHARIKQGVQTGELTKGETVHLKNEQAKIQEDKKEAAADGKVTPQERRHIKKEQNKASRDINRLKHNNRTEK